jgi:L-ascorbate metabolism protein UlaG (beta-lactamase superfamily)
MKIRALGWAGIELESHGQALAIDHVLAFNIAGVPGGARLVDVEHPGEACGALLTHLHEDHCDPSTLEKALAPDAPVFRPEKIANVVSTDADGDVLSYEDQDGTLEQERELSASGLRVREFKVWEKGQVGPFAVRTTPAVDGFGAHQMGWAIEADGQRVFHGGDTLFHGYWWEMAQRVGRVDVAAMAINGATPDWPHVRPVPPYPITTTPEWAAHGAHILGASVIVPIHFGVTIPDNYYETADALPRLHTAAKALGVKVAHLQPGEAAEIADLLK